MLRNIEVLIESSSISIVRYIIGITESYSEGIKEKPLLELKDNIIEVDVLWGNLGYPEWKYEGIRVENTDGNSESFQVVTYNGETLGFIDNTVLDITESSKLERNYLVPEDTMFVTNKCSDECNSLGITE